MENKKISFGYEDTDKSIEVELYGLTFEINKEVIASKDINNLKENDEMKIESEIEEILGNGSVEKINNKRISDGYNKMTLDVEIAVLTCIYKAYIVATSGSMINEIINTNKELENKAKNINREQRRDYNRGQYRRNRRNYRRY